MASSFCDCRSCSSSARRSVMSRMNPVMHGAAVRPDARNRQLHGEVRAVGLEPAHFDLAAGERSAAGGEASLQRADALGAVGRRQQQLDAAAEDVQAGSPNICSAAGLNSRMFRC